MQTILRAETIHPQTIRHKSQPNATNPEPFIMNDSGFALS
jgi:hypothetical protein